MTTFRPSRRSILTWSGAGAFFALTNGFGASPAAASGAASGTLSGAASGAATAAGGWTFDPLLGLFTQPPTPTGTAVAWEFQTDGDAEGWEATRGVAPFTVSGGTLRTTVTGFDPSIFTPPVRLTGSRDRLLRLRARMTGGDYLKLFFATEQEPELSEGKAARIMLPPDGEFHELVVDLGASSESWRSGTVTTIRFDVEPAISEGVELELDYVRIERLGARFAATMFSPDLGSVRVGEQVKLQTTLSNIGGEASAAFPATLSLPEDVALSGPAEQVVPALAPGAEHELTWTARVEAASPGAAVLDLATPASPFRFATVVPAVPNPRLIDRWSPRGTQVFRDGGGNIYLQNKGVRLVLLNGEPGIVQALLDVRSGNSWRRMASAQPLTWIAVSGENGPELLPVVPAGVRLSEGETADVALTGTAKGSDGTTWAVELKFALGAGNAAVQATYAATPDRDTELLAFRGPSLTVGERSFGGEQDRALFPGLEWLVAGERSSSTLDADPPLDLRSTPHPLKVTVPLLAVLKDGALASLQWDTNQAWDGTRKHPTARFASPNWIDGQDNHALTLFVPDVADHVAENAPWATAAPYVATAGRRLQVEAGFVVDETRDVLRALDHWYDAYGLPRPASKPRSWQEELDLIRDAYVTSYWDPEVKGWPHVYGWESELFVPLAAVLQVTALLTPESEARDAAFARVREFTDNVLEVNGSAALGELGGAHIEMFHAPFYLGHLEGSLPRLREQIAQRLAGQGDDGSWRFDPGDDPMRQRLGKKGDEALGLTATPAQRILRWARITGDSDALDGGMKALSYMKKFDVPRAAQTWECPVHTPDVLASAYGVGAYTEGYRLTGDEDLLRRAEYWARTGLAFLYSWEDPARPLMPYASIPVFGTSIFTNPWFGRPVQWNGMVYAYFLLDLVEAAGDELEFPWRQIAEGLVVSAMHQQRTTEPGKGGYPDVWELRENVAIKGVDINPEGLSKPAIMLMGHPVDVQTSLLRRDGKVARLNSAARITKAVWDGSGITARLRFYDGASSQLLLAGAPAARQVSVDGRALASVPSLDEPGVAEGWKQLAGGGLIVKLRHATESTLKVGF